MKNLISSWLIWSVSVRGVGTWFPQSFCPGAAVMMMVMISLSRFCVGSDADDFELGDSSVCVIFLRMMFSFPLWDEVRDVSFLLESRDTAGSLDEAHRPSEELSE